MPNTLRFGIEALDKLLGSGGGAFGLDIAGNQNGQGARVKIPTTSICLIGPDGTGKSVLALHLAAYYMADCHAHDRHKGKNRLPKVLYISTDLTGSMAERMWSNFDLRNPLTRKDPFATRRGKPAANQTDPGPLRLVGKSPKAMNEILADATNAYQVVFVDLAQATAGDDWGFVHRLLSVLDQPKDGYPRHLVLLDAVEGFETLVGELNAFGEKSTRRSRIAQVMRLAACKSHLLFVVEEVKEERLPEEFVTDTVVRLRNIAINDYVRRTVEIEKTRGQAHVRGQHPFVTRSGEGTTTGDKTSRNFDDPLVTKAGKPDEPQSYVHVFTSINHLSRGLMAQQGETRPEPTKGRYAGFGIPYLDSMLAGDGKPPNRRNVDTMGLPCSSVTALIGDALTQKSQLGRAFLSRTFYPFASELAARYIRDFRQSEQDADLSLFIEEQEKRLSNYEKSISFEEINRAVLQGDAGGEPEGLSPATAKVPGVALMITTQDTHHVELAREFIQWLNPASLLGIMDESRKAVVSSYERVLLNYIKAHTICRRMDIHDSSSPILAHIFQRNIEAAQRNLLGLGAEDALPEVDSRYSSSWRIRLVIDDFNALRSTFPDIHNDPLLLPFMIFNLGREGVSALVIDTQSGRLDTALAERYESSLREQADYRLYTWRIPFYGETRVAITAIPQLSMENQGMIRELGRQYGGESVEDDRAVRQLTVDPHFELYAGLERGTPHPVPLEVRLYPGTKTLIKYIAEENTFFKELFVPNAGRSDIITGFEPPNYESFREFCYLQRDTRLDHTLIFQVDEFWLTWLSRQSKTRKAGVLQRQWPYLDTVTVDENGEPERAADAYYLFQKTFNDAEALKADGPAQSAKSEPLRRRDFYDDDRLGYGFKEEKKRKKSEKEKVDRVPSMDEVDRVPFMWDFAFLLCRENLWNEYKNADQVESKEAKKDRVIDVWQKIQMAKTDQREGKSLLRPYSNVSWREFLEASKEVAEYHSAKTSMDIPAFDFGMNDGEAFSCLVLEIWSSEIYASRKRIDERQKKHSRLSFAWRLSEKKWDKPRIIENLSLLEGLRARGANDGTKTLEEIIVAQKEGQRMGYALELYKTWLLLIEVIDFSDLISAPNKFSFEFKSRQSSPDAVSAHHWYQSACDLIDQHELAEDLVAVRLPGHFSVRGDWFLASAGGSRSNRLAQRAIDLLSSRRANIKRLQLGIGLPTRKIVQNPEKEFKHLRTRLVSTDGKTGRLRNVSYEEFLAIAGRTCKGKTDPRKDEEFYWLWRSSIYGYARYSKVWQKWLTRMALWWHTIHTRYRSAWAPGFDLYDKIDNYLDDKPGADGKPINLGDFSDYESWTSFHEMIHILLMELQQVSFGHN